MKTIRISNHNEEPREYRCRWVQPTVKGQWLDGSGNTTRQALAIMEDGRFVLYYCGSPADKASITEINKAEWMARFSARKSAPGQYGNEDWNIE